MTRSDQEHDFQSDRVLEILLRNAEPRPTPPLKDELMVRSVVRAEWDRLTTRRARSRQIARFVLAASVLLAVFVGLNSLRGPLDEVRQVAMIEKRFGIIDVRSNGLNGVEDSAITSLASGQTVETGGDSGLTLAWNDGGSLRLDQTTRVRFDSGSEIYLERGRVYFDSLPGGVPLVLSDPDRARLTIRTDRGMVRHFGTRFITESSSTGLTVMVREGTVLVESDDVREAAGAGQKITLTSDGETTIEAVAVFGGEWEWIEKTSPSFMLDNRPIIEFLDWVGRETGRSVRFTSTEAERIARDKELRGVVDMEPSRALNVYMQTAALAWRIEGDEILVGDLETQNQPGGP